MSEAVDTLERYTARVKSLIVKQVVAPDEAEKILEQYARGLPSILPTTINEEMKGNDLCVKCKGSGQFSIYVGNGLLILAAMASVSEGVAIESMNAPS